MRLPRVLALLGVVSAAWLGGAAAAAGSACTDAALSLRSDDARAMIRDVRYPEAVALARSRLADARSCGRGDSLPAARWIARLAEARDAAGTARADELRGLLTTAIELQDKGGAAARLELADTLDLVGSIFAPIDSKWAVESLERALDLRGRGSDGPKVGGTLRRLATCWCLRGDPGTAAPLLARALAILDRRLGPLHVETIRARALHGKMQALYLDCGGARRTFDQARADVAKALGPNHPETAAVLRALVETLGTCEQQEQARSLANEALRIDELAFGPDHPVVALDLLAVGSTPGPDASSESLPRAETILLNAFGENDPRLAAVLHTRASLEFNQGHEDRWRDLDARAERALVSAFGEDSLVVAEFRAARANGSMSAEPVQARDVLERYVALLETRPDLPPPDLANALAVLGTAYDYMNDGPAAMAVLDRSVAIWDRAAPADTRAVGALSAGAEIAGSVRDFAKSEALYRRVLRILESSCGKDCPSVGNVLQSYAYVLLIKGDARAASPLADRALAIAERVDPNSPETSWCLRRRSEVRRRLGDYAAALESSERAFAIHTRAGGGDEENYSFRAPLIDAYTGLGRHADALAQALELESGARRYFLAQADQLSEREALEFGAGVWRGIGLALRAIASAQPGTLPEGATARTWDALVRARSLVVDEMAARVRFLRSSADPSDALLLDELARTRGRLARMLVRGVGTADPAATAAIGAARQDAERSERALAARSADALGRRVEREFGLREILAALPAGAGLVSYAQYPRFNPTGVGKAVWEYMALVLPPGASEPKAVRLGSADEIDALFSAWNALVSRQPPAGEGALAAERACTRAGTRLREAIWDPVERLLGHPRLALIVPDGQLQLMSFAALPAADGSYLAEGETGLQLVSTERDIAALALPWKRGSRLLAFGAPDFDGAVGTTVTNAGAAPATETVAAATSFRGPGPDCSAFRSTAFAPLPRARLEVDQVVALWNQRLASGGSGLAIERTSADATESAFKSLAPGSRVLHVATHGIYFDPTSCHPEQGRSAEEAKRDGPLLTFAALALAGANRRDDAPADAEDGILTAEEIAALDLTGVEWAVLSACDSGNGTVQTREGIFGLRRALQIAGARTLITSLWGVRDEDTRAFMESLYRARTAQASTAAAMRAAELDMLRSRRKRGLSTHPFYWGAFVASGDWR